MSGHVSWVQVLLRELAPMAAYVHCASHRLNLMLNKLITNATYSQHVLV